MWQVTLASAEEKLSSQTVPHELLWKISTRPRTEFTFPKASTSLIFFLPNEKKNEEEWFHWSRATIKWMSLNCLNPQHLYILAVV